MAINSSCEVISDDETTMYPSIRKLSVATENFDHIQHLRAWLKSIFFMSDQKILDRLGNDVLQYLRFQRHVICFLVGTSVLSLAIVLPINMQGKLRSHEKISLNPVTFLNRYQYIQRIC